MAVSIQQAGVNVFARWLEQKLTGVKVESRWPTGGYKMPDKSITVVCAGQRQDQSIEHRLIALANNGPNDVDLTIQVAACTQPLQLDVWAKSWNERDSICADLDSLLRYGAGDVVPFADPSGNSVLLKLEDGWESTGTFVDFEFDSPDFEESGDALERSIFRATFRGASRFMLTVPRRTARQKVINFSLLLNESDAASTEPAERDLSTVSGA